MSRGLGTVQRRIMAAIDGQPEGEYSTLYDLAPNGDRSEIEGLRRAVKSLERRGLVQTSYKDGEMRVHHRRNKRWKVYKVYSRPRVLGFRVPPSLEFQLSEHEERLAGLKQVVPYAFTYAGRRWVLEQITEESETIAALKDQIDLADR